MDLRYCLLLILLPMLAIPCLILFGSSNLFLQHGASVWVRANDAIFNIQGRSCDVLVFGDSTAMTGINPAIVESNTGFRTCNIAVTNAVLAVTNTLTLDHYLAHNARPKVILVQLSPDSFLGVDTSWHQTIYPEGLLELLRHGPAKQKISVLLTHPREAVAFAGYAAGFGAYSAIKSTWFHLTGLRPEEDALTVNNGFFTPPTPARTHCDSASTIANPRSGDRSRQVAERYRQNYALKGDLVIVNVAPIPSCDSNLRTYQSELRGVTSNSLLPLPVGLFNDGRHYTATGSTIVSRLVAQEVNLLTRNSLAAANAHGAHYNSVAMLR